MAQNCTWCDTDGFICDEDNFSWMNRYLFHAIPRTNWLKKCSRSLKNVRVRFALFARALYTHGCRPITSAYILSGVSKTPFICCICLCDGKNDEKCFFVTSLARHSWPMTIPTRLCWIFIVISLLNLLNVNGYPPQQSWRLHRWRCRRD